MTPTAEDFRAELSKLLAAGSKLGFVAVDVIAGSLHRLVGIYPGSGHRIPVCCDVTIAVAMPAGVAAGDDVITLRYNEKERKADGLVKLSRRWQ